FTFKLPDNLTSWRITAQAVNAGLFAGDNTINITTNLPMFLSPVIPEVFLSGDTVGFSARVYGADIDSSAEVAYTAVIAESGIDSKIKPIVINERAGANAYFVFGPLPSGTYEATITAECEGFSDGVKKTFEVLDSHIETWVRKDMSIKDLLVPAKRFPVFIGFYNAEYSVYESVLSDLVFRGNDWRADSRIAATVALEMQEKLSDVSLYTYFGKPNIDDITYSGGVSLGRFTEPDALLTARIAAAAPDYMSNRETVSYFRDIIRNPVATSEQVSAAYMGLAAIGEPVLLDVKGLLEGDTGFDEVDTLRLIAAVALAGDYDAAIGFSSQYISPKLVRDTHGCVFYRISDTNREQENIAATATASITVSILNGSSSQNMARYLRTHKSDYDLTVTEQAVFLRHFRPEVTEEAKISYMTKEGPQEITLGKIGIRYIPFTKEDLDIADIRQLSGNVRARVNYIGSLEELDDAGEALYQVEKTMSPDCVAGDTVTVTVTVKGLTKWSFVMVDDYIPTGMRYADILNEYSYSRDWYFAGHERQNIKFALYSQNGGDITFSYKLRAVTPGEYVVESAAARSFRGGYGISPRGKVTITE
ncbi:MAG: hypothetical protein LBH09_04960, partial [Peptococcaceae bacterium]|nr:hypothetical protein [Peptococcaceae bacterium]